MSTYARVIADSISPAGHRLTTMEVRFHRFVLAEFNTHRAFSRNSASSRAIPLSKQLTRIREDPALPVSWPAEQPGMQGGEEVEYPQLVEQDWRRAAASARGYAQAVGGQGVHKSVANRLLEPFMWHTVVVTSTAWENFFGLRCNPLAQPEIRVAAEAMKQAYDGSTPAYVGPGEWHLPCVYGDDWQELADLPPIDAASILVRISAARCARVSYLTQDGQRDHEADLALYDRLVSADPMHASPLEHVATPNQGNSRFVVIRRHLGSSPTSLDRKAVRLPMYGNLLGWHQHRFDVEVGADYQAYA